MPIKVKSVRIIQTCRNYETVFAALYCLDLMISDGVIYDETDGAVPLKLIKKLLGVANSSSSFDPYISSMVKAYIRCKRQIVININGLSGITAVYGFVTEDIIKEVATEKDDCNPDVSKSRSNMVSPDIVSTFPNAESVVIKAGNEKDGYPFDMFYFASSMIRASNWKSIRIEQKMSREENFNKSWISKLWQISESELVHHYKQHQLEISFVTYEQISNTRDSFECFAIRRV